MGQETLCLELNGSHADDSTACVSCHQSGYTRDGWTISNNLNSKCWISSGSYFYVNCFQICAMYWKIIPFALNRALWCSLRLCLSALSFTNPLHQAVFLRDLNTTFVDSTQQAPTPVNTVTRGDIDKVKLSDSFPDKKNVFEVHTKSGIVWYLQCATPVGIHCYYCHHHYRHYKISLNLLLWKFYINGHMWIRLCL